MSQQLAAVATIILAILLPSQAQVNQQATLYTGSNGNGQTLTLIENYQPNLQQQGWNNNAYSTCVVGAWLYYDYENYNQNTGGLMEWVFGPGQKCVNFNNLQGAVSSVRFAGSPKDWRTSTFTLYARDYFMGAEEYIYQDQPSIALQDHRSLIVTGNTGYTVYDQTNYQGNSICIFPQDAANYTPAFVYDLSNISIPYGAIRSVRKGCYGKKVVRPKSEISGKSTQQAVPVPESPLLAKDLVLTNKKF